MITSLAGLAGAFDSLYEEITPVCINCNRYCCVGYIWLLDEEADCLYENDVSILEVNERVYFINCFSQGEEIDVSRLKPVCPLRKDRLCSIHGIRPLMCRMYPIGFDTLEGVLHVVIHKDCEFTAGLGSGFEDFARRLIGIFEHTDTRILRELLSGFKRVDFLAMFPDGRNEVIPIKPVEEILRERG